MHGYPNTRLSKRKNGESSYNATSYQTRKITRLGINATPYGIPLQAAFEYASTQTPILNQTLKQIADAPNKLLFKKLTFNYGNKPVKGATDSVKIHFTNNSVASVQSGDQLVNPGSAGFAENGVLIPRYLTAGQILGTSTPSNDDRPLLRRGSGGSPLNFSLYQANQSAVSAIDPSADNSYITDVAPHPRNQYLVVKNMDETITLKNTGTFPCSVQIYWFMCKNADSQHPYTEMVDEMVADVRGQASAVVTDTNIESGAISTPIFMPDYGPGNLKQWKANWRIFHAESFAMEQNEQVKFIIHHRINRVLYKDNVEDNLSGYIPGLSVCPMVFSNGGLGTYLISEEKYCSTSPVNLCSLVSRHYEFGFLPKKVIAPPFQAFNLRHGRGATVQEVEDDSDVVVDYVTS